MNINRVCFIPAIGALFLLGACGTHVPKPQIIERPGLDAISSSGTSSTAYVKTNAESDRFCEGRGVDAVSSSSTGLSLSGGLPTGTSASIGEAASSGALSLGGRDPVVLLARELMYRACELSLNLSLSLDDTKEIYFRFLQTIETVSANENTTGTDALGFQGSVTVPAGN